MRIPRYEELLVAGAIIALGLVIWRIAPHLATVYYKNYSRERPAYRLATGHVLLTDRVLAVSFRVCAVGMIAGGVVFLLSAAQSAPISR